jgi:hypothetical protein
MSGARDRGIEEIGTNSRSLVLATVAIRREPMVYLVGRSKLLDVSKKRASELGILEVFS